MNIYDIAKQTGYSPATVARAFSGGYCSDKAKKKIFEVAGKNNYKPNLSAKALRSNKTQRILFCIPDICNPFYFRMIEGALDVLEQKDYTVMLYSTGKSLKKELKAIDMLDKKVCDGVILISFDFNETNINTIRNSGRPVVLGNRFLSQKDQDNFDYVYVDHIAGMELAANHLIEQGCKNIVLVTGSMQEQTTFERVQGFKFALDKANIEWNDEYLINGNYELESSRNAFIDFIRSGKSCDGVIASNDLAAYGVLKGCKELGISVPQNIKLVSFDNTDYAELGNPSITSVDMCQYQLGGSLAKTLLSRIEGRTTVENVNLRPNLVIRESSK